MTMTIRNLLDTLVALAGGDDVVGSKLQAEIEKTISTVDAMFYIVADHCEDILGQWTAMPDEDQRLTDDEEYALIGGAALIGEEIEWPEGYLEQGGVLEHDDES